MLTVYFRCYSQVSFVVIEWYLIHKDAICSEVIESLVALLIRTTLSVESIMKLLAVTATDLTSCPSSSLERRRRTTCRSVSAGWYLQVGVVEPIVHTFVTLKLIHVSGQIECTCWVV